MKFTQRQIDGDFIYESWGIIKSVIPKHIWILYPVQEDMLHRDACVDHAIKLYMYVQGTLLRSGSSLKILYGQQSEVITMEYFCCTGFSLCGVGTNFLEAITCLLSNIKQTNLQIDWK